MLGQIISTTPLSLSPGTPRARFLPVSFSPARVKSVMAESSTFSSSCPNSLSGSSSTSISTSSSSGASSTSELILLVSLRFSLKNLKYVICKIFFLLLSLKIHSHLVK